MAEEWKGYYGKDGKRYKDAVELWNANKVVENQEEQTRLLRMNAELSVLQAEQEERKMQQAKELENERREHEKQMEQSKYEHERELLLLKIFDDVSIPLGVYEKFEQNLLNGGNISQENSERYAKLMKSASDIMSKRIQSLGEMEELIQRNMNYPNNEVRYTDKYKKFEDFINGKVSITEFNENEINIIQDNQEVVETFNKIKKEVKSALTTLKVLVPMCSIFGIIGLIVSMHIASEFHIYATYLWPITSFVTVLIGITGKDRAETTRVGTLKQELNKSINSQMANEYSQDNISEEEKSINEELKQIQAEINESSKTIIDQRLQNLYNFRLEHYNLKIEKLFYDVGLVNKCIENDYNWLDIDKKNIKNEGTYEDYFHYFNNYNPNNEEPQGE